ncbi:ABC transporter permease [Tessaracoccus oleiagri]|uniref:Simple sugar transport system permease protein n=1 Tax=Tessaracoccus oleiagri TaxID=686624 RepID=A0A1G9JK90_9ACTN|nr:ABC transporter permease [Tessaracoccus oleiagri]SDL37939.1 simple sugar transport system permease protein [Tessaracoccus oleiagri]
MSEAKRVEEAPPKDHKPETKPKASYSKWLNSAAVTFWSLVLAFIVGSIVMIILDPEVGEKWGYFFARPGDALGASWEKISLTYISLLQGSFGSWVAFTETTAQATPLILAGLGIALAFRAGLFNIGGQGQAIMGAIWGAFIGFTVKGLPLFVHLPLVILVGVAMGTIWGGIVGFLKAKTGAHEVIVTIMMNYLAVYLLQFLLQRPAFMAPGRNDPIGPVVEWSATMPRLAGSRLHLGFLLALLAVVLVWWILERTTLGLRIQAVGLNPHAAAVAGINVSRVTIVTMAISGALAGMAGVNAVTAPELITSFPTQLSVGIVGAIGFDAITVALLGRSRPVGVLLAGLLFGALKAGARTMQVRANTPSDLVDLIQALIVLFVAAPAFVMWVLPFLRQRKTSRTPKPKAVAA